MNILNNKTFKENFNPYRNEKCLEWYLDNDEDFKESIIKQEIVMIEEMYFDNLCDSLTYNSNGDKPVKWALDNYEELEFSFEFNPSWYCDNDKLGTWQEFNPCKWAQDEDSGQAGIFITTVQGGQEIELQCDNGDLVYISCGGYFKVLARVA